ncbi:MAG: class I SAM-dependent DNA methyltransferase [Chloroflexota bacterium]
MSVERFGEKVSFIWSVADLLRGPYRPPQYGEVMLPLTVLRRLDCVLAETKPAVLALAETLKDAPPNVKELRLNRAAGQQFHNTSRLDLTAIVGQPDQIADNLSAYIRSFSPKARQFLEHFGIEEQIQTLIDHDRLYLVLRKFVELDLHPRSVSNIEMGYVFEDLIRRFSEQRNEQAGDHFTPREVIRLMVNLIFSPDMAELSTPGIVKTLFDPACGTGGMLSVADAYMHELNPGGKLILSGQEVNPASYAICGSDMLIKGQEIDRVRLGDSFTNDGHEGRRFDYMLANPPFGVDWKVQQARLTEEHKTRGFAGRFGAGLPRVNDGSFLFLQHMLSKRQPTSAGGTRLGIVFNGSPLFTGDAGSGESNIRRWIVEQDWLEAIVALPDQLFYNTGISTYVWIVTNRKERERQGKIQLIDATGMFKKMRRSLGNKRNEIADEQIAEITTLYGDFQAGELVRIFDNEDFGYRKITVERPLRLSFAATPERIARLWEQKAFRELAPERVAKGRRKRSAGAKLQEEFGGRNELGRNSLRPYQDGDGEQGAGLELGPDGAVMEATAEQATILAVVRALPAGRMDDRAAFERELETAARRRGVKLAAPVRKAILAALGERDETAQVCRDAKGEPEADPELRDTENVPLKEDVDAYFAREVAPHVPDAWVNRAVVDERDGQVGKVGYEINFNRYFYRYVPPRPLEEIEAEMKVLEREIVDLLREVAG